MALTQAGSARGEWVFGDGESSFAQLVRGVVWCDRRAVARTLYVSFVALASDLVERRCVL